MYLTWTVNRSFFKLVCLKNTNNNNNSNNNNNNNTKIHFNFFTVKGDEGGKIVFL